MGDIPVSKIIYRIPGDILTIVPNTLCAMWRSLNARVMQYFLRIYA